MIKSLSSFVKAIVIFLLVFVVYQWFNGANRTFEYVDNLTNLDPPYQSEAEGEERQHIDNYEVYYQYVAEYSISGKVADVQDYYSYSIFDRISPRDIGMCWGPVATNELNKNVSFYSIGDRFLNFLVKDRTWLTEIGGIDVLYSHCSNNHLIPKDKDTKKLIKSIRKNDYIRIDGYLVNVYAVIPDKSRIDWKTSTIRNDRGKGACEIIYVTDVTWLKERK